jgi:hypothetical protein
MEHNRKVLQEIIDRVDPHDKLRNDAMAIKIAELYAEWAVKNCSIHEVINQICDHPSNERIKLEGGNEQCGKCWQYME